MPLWIWRPMWCCRLSTVRKQTLALLERKCLGQVRHHINSSRQTTQIKNMTNATERLYRLTWTCSRELPLGVLTSLLIGVPCWQCCWLSGSFCAWGAHVPSSNISPTGNLQTFRGVETCSSFAFGGRPGRNLVMLIRYNCAKTSFFSLAPKWATKSRRQRRLV